jgi:hypothetical protein
MEESKKWPPDLSDPHLREWIDDEYRRVTAIREAELRPLSRRDAAPDAVAAADGNSGNSSYQCPRCGRILRLADVLRQELGDKAEDLLEGEMMVGAGNAVWALALENFQAFHECEPDPTEQEIRQNWKRLALRKLLRYTVGGSAVLLVWRLFNGDRMSLSEVSLTVVICALFFFVVLPLFLVLSIPLLDREFRAAWARRIREEWEKCKTALVRDHNRRLRGRIL